MTAAPEIRTARLLLRPWRDADRAPYAALNAEAGIPRSDSDDLIDCFNACRAEDGVSYAAVERAADGAFLGMAGLALRRFDAPDQPACEIGWAILRAHRGQGYAAEAARGWLAHAFGPLALPEVTALVAPANAGSRALALRLGFVEAPPLPGRPDIVYRLTRAMSNRTESSGG
ncbi:MAG: GNAT family N-acetyltransferase [Amaricoccus sp.]|uniref:GNAT family N-acetyltransferase n=1 Tax=Amaricoccus sp. TaxID=1872485 RepID=UPI0033148B1F